jgi:hypothetical protein
MSINCYLHAVDASAVDRLLDDPGEIESVIHNGKPGCDLHKAWHAIHYVLTGTPDGGAEPNNLLLLGGTELDDELDDGYGPPRLLTPEQVKAFDGALRPFDAPGALAARFDHAGMVRDGVYAINPDSRADELEFTEHFFTGLRAFIRDAAAAGQGVLVSMG